MSITRFSVTFLSILGVSPAFAASTEPCAGLTLERCMVDRPTAAKLVLLKQAPSDQSGYSWRLLGDLAMQVDDMEAASAYYRKAIDLGDPWSAVPLSEVAASAPNLAGDILAFFEMSGRPDDVSAQTFAAAATLRDKRSEPERAKDNLAAALSSGNPWSGLTLAWMAVKGEDIPLAPADLAVRMETLAASGKEPGFRESGLQALEALYRNVLNDHAAADRTLAELATLDGETGRSARVRLVLAKAQSSDLDADDLSFLRSEAKAGNAEAAFALGTHLSKSQEADERKEGRGLLREAVAKEPSRGSYGWSLIGESFLEDKPQDTAGAIGAFEKSAEAGNAWAQMRLAIAYRDGAGVPKSVRKAEEHAHSALDGDAPQAGLVALLSLYNTPVDPSAEEIVDAAKKAVAHASPEEIVQSIAWMDTNRKTKLLQSLWWERGLLKGAVDGIVGKETIRVFLAACREQDVSACRTSLMPDDLVRSELERLRLG